MKTLITILFTLIINLTFSVILLSGQQIADPNFDARVEHPAYTGTHPKILFDEAHHNFHTAAGRYKPLVDLLTNDGYVITPNKEKFQRGVLKGYDILIIANAMGAERQNMPEADKPAFTDEEYQAVRDWVEAGGALLLIADHAPFGAATEKLAGVFGVDMGKGTTIDDNNYDQEDGNNNRGFLVYSRDNKLLTDNPITNGRNQSERVSRVITFTGQSLKGPVGSFEFLKLSDTAKDRPTPSADAPSVPLDRLPNGQPLPPGVTVQGRRASGPPVSSAGRAQGIAFNLAKGRVIVLGEAAVISAQLIQGVAAQAAGKSEIRMGMNRKGIDNRQLGLNIMHWLSRLLN